MTTEGLPLPPLPEPFMELHRELSPVVYEGWARQMREYAAQAVKAARAQERERVAAWVATQRNDIPATGEDCAAAIRAMED